MAGPSFLLNVTLNRDKQITAVFAGDLDQAHERGCAFVKQHAMAPVQAPYDIVITSNSGYPLDLNLYQAVKGMSAAAQIVKKGGAIILAADCWDGIPEHGQYKRLLVRGGQSSASLLERVRADDCHCQDAWQAQIHAQVCEKADVYLFSHNLTDEQIEQALLKPCRDIAGTVEQLLRVYGRDASICVLPEGPQTIPYIATWCTGGVNAVKIVVALDSFKGSLTAVQACDIVAGAIRSGVPDARGRDQAHGRWRRRDGVGPDGGRRWAMDQQDGHGPAAGDGGRGRLCLASRQPYGPGGDGHGQRPAALEAGAAESLEDDDLRHGTAHPGGPRPRREPHSPGDWRQCHGGRRRRCGDGFGLAVSHEKMGERNRFRRRPTRGDRRDVTVVVCLPPGHP